MNLLRACTSLSLLAALVAGASAQGPIRPLAQDHVVVFESPDPARVFCYTPALERLPSGRLVATFDLGGPGIEAVPGPKGRRGKETGQCKVFVSDDHGRTWAHRGDFPMFHATPFRAGASLYILGHAGDLTIVRSDDDGQTWSEPKRLTEGQTWTGHAHNVLRANGQVYIAMERYVQRGWNTLAPVLLRGAEDADLTQRDHWTFASELTFNEAVDTRTLDYFGVPFFPVTPTKGVLTAPGRPCAPAGWLETNVVQITDPNHVWCDPSGKTLHLWLRAHTGGTGLACVAKVVEQGDRPGQGPMTTMLEQVPSGRKCMFVPLPGGQMKFFILYDEPSRRYWLLSTQGTDSMCRPDRLPAERFNLPNNERRRLQLHFSKNMIDWCFAGIVAIGPQEKASRHYAGMVVDGDDLHVLSRSGDERAKNAHDGDILTFHTIHDFRRLVY